MAIAVEALGGAAEGAEGAASGGAATRAAGFAQSGAQGVRNATGSTVQAARAGYQRVSSPSSAAQTVTRLLWAVALGLIVLEIASEATGQYWDFKLPAQGTLQKEPYRPLYGPGATAPAPASPGAPSPPGSSMWIPAGTTPPPLSGVQKTIGDYTAGVF